MFFWDYQFENFVKTSNTSKTVHLRKLEYTNRNSIWDISVEILLKYVIVFSNNWNKPRYSVPEIFLSNLVEFVLPRIYEQFLQISTSFSVEENPHVFVKIWFTEKHQREPGESIVFCCSTPAVESDSSLTWNSLKKSAILVLEEKFLKNYLPLEIYTSFTQVSSLIVFLYFCKVSNEGITAC